MSDMPSPVLKSVPPPVDASADSEALKKIRAAYKAKCAAEDVAANAKRALADARKERLDALTEANENIRELIGNAEKAPKKDHTVHLNGIIDAQREKDTLKEELDEKVAQAQKAFKDAESVAVAQDNALRTTIVDSNQGSFPFE